MHTVLIVIHVLLAIALIGMVLVQRGPGASAGAAFGSGASSTVFGSRGAGSFLTRTTGILAAGFFLVSLSMAVLVSRGSLGPAESDLGIMGALPQQEEQSGPAPDDVPAVPQARSAEGEGEGDVPAPPARTAPEEEDGDGSESSAAAAEEDGA